MGNDKTTTIADLKAQLREFREERDWAKFHDPKNLASAISIEAGELQELFLWKTIEEVQQQIQSDDEFKARMEDELADIVSFCLNLALSADVDVASAVNKKIARNSEKYPAEKVRGQATKYNEL